MQSCGNSSTTLTPKQNESTHDTLRCSKQLDRKQLIGKELTAEGGHLVTFHEQEGRLHANVEMNAPTGFSKTYSDLSVNTAQNTDLSHLFSLSSKEQAKSVHLIPSKKSTQLPSVGIAEMKLRGGRETGGNDENPKSKGKEKGKEKEEEKTEGNDDDVKELEDNIITDDLLWQQLLGIATDQKIEKTVSHSWATGPGINAVLNDLLQEHAHIIHPDLSCVYSPAAHADSNASQGAENYGVEISKIICSDNKMLRKPIIMIINTNPVGVLKTHDITKEGGLHWQACVILPKNYKTLSGTPLNNQKEVIFYIDSSNPDKQIPNSLLNILTASEWPNVIESEGKVYTQMIQLFPNAEVRDKLGARQQKDGWSCGYWAVYNALMIVYTGGTEYLKHFASPSRGIASKLRTLLPGLDEKAVPKRKGEEKGGKNPMLPRKVPQYGASKYRADIRLQPVDSRLVAPSLTPDGLKTSLHGDLYQLGLLTLVAIRAHNDGKNFHLVSEAKECEKFDDLVIDYGDRITFLQAKHSSKNPKEDGYTKTDFCANLEGDASLAKYFDSWLRLKRGKYVKKEDGGEKASKFIFFTNRHVKDEKEYLDPTAIEADEFLFKGLQTKEIKFKQGESRSIFIDAIRTHSKEIRNHKDDKAAIDLKSFTKELQTAGDYLRKKFPAQDFKVDGHSKLSKKVIALIGLIKTDEAVKQAIIAKVKLNGFKEWMDTVKFTVNMEGAYEVLSAPMEKEIQQFLDEIVIKVEQPSVSPLLQLLADEFNLSTGIGSSELCHVVSNRMLEWLCDSKTCLMKSDEFNKLVNVTIGDLHRFYLLGSTKAYEQEFEDYPLSLKGLEIEGLSKFLATEHKLTLAVVSDNGGGGVKARVYHTIKRFREEHNIQDAEWSFLNIDSKYFGELSAVLAGPSTKFVVVDCRNKDRVYEKCKEILRVSAENGKKLVLLLNPSQKEEVHSLRNETNNRCCEINLDALTDEQVRSLCKQHSGKYLYIGGKSVSLSSVLESKDSGLYRQLENMDSLCEIIESLVETSDKMPASGLPYDVYVENDLVQGIPCYGLLYLLQTVNAELFVIDGVEKKEIDNWLKQELGDKYAVGKSSLDEAKRYRLVNDLKVVSTSQKASKEKLICISNAKEIAHDSYVRLKVVNPKEYEVIVQSKGSLVELPVSMDYYFGENEAHGKDMKIKYAGTEFLREQKSAFTVLTAHAGFGKSAFCLNQLATWRSSEEQGLPLWVVRINLPQLKLPEEPSFCDAFTSSFTSEDWPAWKLNALQHDMQTSGRVFLFLDGFDEIKAETDVERLNNWIKKLPHNTSVLITTRPYAANRIVPNISYRVPCCMTLKEYNEKQHKDYIHKYLDVLFKELSNVNPLRRLSESDLNLLVDKVYGQLKSLISKSTTHLLGIPLESYIFCEALRPHIKEQWLKQEQDPDVKASSDVAGSMNQALTDVSNPGPYMCLQAAAPKSDNDKEKEDMKVLDIESIFAGLTHLNMAILYQHFILSRLQMFLQKHMQMNPSTTLKFKRRVYTLAASHMEVLMAFAFKQAFGLPYSSLSMMLEKTHYNAEMICELEDTGLVEVVERDKEYILKFNHETYQEYFAALYILKSLASEQGDMYDETEQAIINHCYIPKYRMIMMMAAQLSLSGDSMVPAWNPSDEAQVRKFWKLLATSGDVLGAALSRLLKDCVQGLLPDQIASLSMTLKDCVWGVQILKCIEAEAAKKESDDKSEVEEQATQDIDIPFETENTILKSGQYSKMDDEKKIDLKNSFKDRTKVFKATKDALLTISPADIAKIFNEIVTIEANTLNHYWDINGGFQAIALLGNCFNMNHADYFVRRIEADPSWRVPHAFPAICSLFAQSLKGEAKAACETVIICLAQKYEHIESSKELSAMLKKFFKIIMEALITRFHTELSSQTVNANIAEVTCIQSEANYPLSGSIFYKLVCNFIKMLNIAYQAEYAVIPNENYSSIRFVSDVEINFELGNTPLMSIFQDIIRSIFEGPIRMPSGKISRSLNIQKWKNENLRKLYEPYEKKIFIAVENEEIFKGWFEQVKNDGGTLYNLYRRIAEHDLIAEYHVDMLASELKREGSPARKKGFYWSVNGGIETTKFCWRYFNKEIAGYLIFRATECWNDNMWAVEKVLAEVRNNLLKNPTDDEIYEAAIEAYNFAAEEINKDPKGWQKGEKLKLIIPPKIQAKFLKAVKHNDEAEVKKLLEYGVSVNFQNDAHLTALHLTAFSRNNSIATLLLNHSQINVNIQGVKGSNGIRLRSSRVGQGRCCSLLERLRRDSVLY